MRDQKSERTIIKADSGFFVATYIEAGSGVLEPESGKTETWPHSFALLHVIAWEIERTADGVHIVTPLTIDGNPDRCSNKWLIKTPDGTYIMQEETEFETEEQALNYCRHWVEGEREEARKMRHNAPKRAATFFRNLNRRWSSPKQERSM